MTDFAKPSTPVQSRFLALDVLRGFAILAIVAYHCLPITNIEIDRWPFWMNGVKFGGKLGVSLFFVLSGFSIHFSQLRHRWSAQTSEIEFEMNRSQWQSFFQRRFWRLYPSYLAALSLAIGLNWGWSFIRGRNALFPAIEDLLAHLFLVHPFFPNTFFGIIPALWFIGVQAHLYLLYPIFWAWIQRWNIDRAVLAVLAITLLSRLLANTLAFSNASESLTAAIWMNAPQRWFEWCCGAWVAHRIVQNQWLPFSSTILAGLVGAVWSIWGDTFRVLDEPVLGAIISSILWGILNWRLNPPARVRSLKSSPSPRRWNLLLSPQIPFAGPIATRARSQIERILIALGYLSYPIYLTHQIFIPYVRSALDRLSSQLSLQTLLLFLIVSAITLPVSIWFDRQIDRRIQKRKVAKRSIEGGQ